MRERPDDGREGKLLPGNVGAGETRAIHDLNLADAGHAVHRQQAVDLDRGAGLFARLAFGGLFRRLAELHIARRHGPETLARLNCPLGEQDAIAPGADGAGDDPGILVMDELATRAHQPLAVVAVGNALLEMVRRVPWQPRTIR